MAILYWSPSDGNNTTGDGSYSTPYKTTTKCFSVCANDDELVLKKGVHVLAEDISDLIQNQPVKTGVTIRGESSNARENVIDGSDGTYGIGHYLQQTGVVLFKDIMYRGMKTGYPPLYLGAHSLTCTFQNLIYDKCQAYGAFSGQLSPLGNNQTLVFDRIIINDLTTGIDGLNYIMRGGGTDSVITVQNCTFFFKTARPPSYLFSAYNVSGCTVKLLNNIVLTKWPATTWTLAMCEGNNVTAWEIKNNIQYGASSYTLMANTPLSLVDENNIVADPKFVDESMGYFQLQKDSPAINIGGI
jgi:hypothetical protein